jgi:hypothetical protein
MRTLSGMLKVVRDGAEICTAIGAFVQSSALTHSHFLPYRYMASRNRVVGQIERSRTLFSTLEVVEDGTEARVVISVFVLSPDLIHSQFLPYRYLSGRNLIVGQIERLRALSNTLEVLKHEAEVRIAIGAFVLSPGLIHSHFLPSDIYPAEIMLLAKSND